MFSNTSDDIHPKEQSLFPMEWHKATNEPELDRNANILQHQDNK